MNVVGNRHIWFIISLALIAIGIGSFLFQGLNLGIDFTGGNLMQVKFATEVAPDQVREIVSKYVKETPVIQESEENNFLIRTTGLSEEVNAKMVAEFTDKLGANEILRNEHVGPVIGKELTQNALYALLLASILMVVYITFRFEFMFAIAAIIALLHDVLVTVGLFSLLQIEVDGAFVAAILTILGYSINSTIVIFDRVRENLRKQQKEPLAITVDTSIRQTLARCINTALTVVFTLVALLVLGGETTKVFALALLIGVISGTYTSVFIASPVWIELTSRFTKRGLVKVKA